MAILWQLDRQIEGDIDGKILTFSLLYCYNNCFTEVADTLCYLLVGTSDQSAKNIELVSRTPQELYEIVCLIG